VNDQITEQERAIAHLWGLELDVAPVREMKAIPLADYEFVVKCLNTARELLITEGVGTSARIEIDWALVGLGQDIPA
jgi:hypothetical protein